MRRLLVAPHHHARLLSLDVALAALGGGVLAQRLAGVAMSWAWWVVLPAAVWCIYTLDHLLDASRVGAEASTARHRFHHQHFLTLSIACGIIGVSVFLLAVTQLQPAVVAFGLALGAVVAAHLVLTELVGGRASPLLVKELGVGVVFAAGVWGPPLVVAQAGVDASLWFAATQYFLLVMVNLVVFSWYEHRADATDGHTSFVRGIGPRRVPGLIAGLLVAAALLGVASLAMGRSPTLLAAEIIYAAMAALLALLMLKPDWFGRHERYRLWGDGAFLLPWLIVLVG